MRTRISCGSRHAGHIGVGFALLGIAILASASTAQAQRSRTPRTPPAEQATPATDAPATPPPETARDLFARGQAAYQLGDYASACELWERAYALEPRPALQYNLAQSYGRLGRLEQELAALRRYIDGAPLTDSTLPSARARVLSIEQRLAQTGIVLTGPDYDGARIVIDGEDRGRLPHPDTIPLRPGSHVVDVQLDGYGSFHAAVAVPAGETLAVTVTMERSGASPNAHPLRLPIALYAAGGGLLITGSVIGGVALSQARSSFEGTDEADRSHTLAIVSDVTIGLGAAAAVTGLIVHVMRGSSDEAAPATARITLAPYVARDGFGVTGRF
jgi:tetratricopeptide (TPR) repeat protein